MNKKEWIPWKSKWKAAEEKGLNLKLKGGENILYLGASSGSTISFLSRYTSRVIFGVEKSFKMMVSLIKKTSKIKNLYPLFCDARDLDYIRKMVGSKKINILFQDIPSFDQVDILINASKLVDKDCRIFFSLKMKSISQKANEELLRFIKDKLKSYFVIVEESSLEPFHKGHWFFVLKKKE